ncbi:UPF0182 family protein [Gleimia hominis]|uniref:UPF0182 protein QS713_07005 n=1 Tax=Gleimia hominis TaxID=595468 RepID=A0ABU3IBS8_9ACTO|nr:UPF0182 family protein [Gleimia hominis]MDT3767806.1 UPF0182 family protein [Gleimia hominis]
MTFFSSFPRPPAGGRPPSGPRKPSGGNRKRKGLTPLRLTLLILAVVAGLLYLASTLGTEVLWFNQLRSARVLWTKWLSVAAIVVVATACIATIVGVNMTWAYRKRPQSTRGGVGASLREYQQVIEPARRVIFWGIPLVIGLFTGLGLAVDWRRILMFINGTSFGQKDPQFGFDLSFYVFTLPIVQMLLSLLTTVFVVSLIAVAVVHYLYGAVTFTPKLSVTVPARRQLGINAAILSLIVALRYWVARYALLVAEGRPNDGAMFTDVHAQLPAQTILAVTSVLVAVLFLIAAFRGTWHLPAAGVAVTVVSALVFGMAYPALIQQFKVKPNERALQAPYIQRNIDATLQAYGIDDVDSTTYAARTDTEPGQLRGDAESTQQIRLIDPDIISPAVRQLKQSRSYYTFEDMLNVDRYEIDGEKRDTVIAVRELNLDGLDDREQNWVNHHTIFTHGYGVVAAYGNRVGPRGEPQWWEEGIPSSGDMGKYEQRVYFSPESPEYSIVGAPEGSDPLELDYPDEQHDGHQVPTTFSGDGGPNVGSILNKILYAIKFQETNILFASQINPKSQILYDRDPALRVSKIAPYLTLDRRPYPAVVDTDGNPKTPKRLVWIVDGYTTSNQFPYSQHLDVNEETRDATTANTQQYAANDKINYIRNSVKAVVDAYDGSVQLYQWDKQDPILKTWMKTFPGQVKPLEDISGDLMAHMRYPQDLFKVQRSMLSAYHVTKAEDFYTGGDRWRLAENPTSKKGPEGVAPAQPPYYLTMKMPDQDSAEFSLTSVFVPGGKADREPMSGFLAVDSETGNEPGKIREGYGKLRLLALPSSTTVPGPGQAQNDFNSDTTIGPALNLLNQEGSEVILGNLLTLPVGGGLLYVQPVYVQGTGSTKYPVLGKVLTSFGDSRGFADSLEESLDATFKGDSAAHLAGNTGAEGGEAIAGGEAKGEGKSDAQRLAAALEAADKAIKDGQEALKNGDWQTYGKKQAELQKHISEAMQADKSVKEGQQAGGDAKKDTGKKTE